MGYGGGFMTVFLGGPEHKRVTVCYPFQIFPVLPTEEHDKRMDGPDRRTGKRMTVLYGREDAAV